MVYAETHIKSMKSHWCQASASKCGEFNQVTSKWQTDVLEKTWTSKMEKVNTTIVFYILESV